MAAEEDQTEILEILRIIKSSPAMNGGFDELVTRVGDIKDIQGKIVFDLNSVMVRQEETHSKVDEIQKAMYHPDDGIYKRIGDVKLINETITEDISELKTRAAGLNETIGAQEKRLGNIETTDKALKEIGGFNLQNLDGAIQLNKHAKKIFWAIVIAVLTIIAKEALPFIAAFF